MTRVLTVCALGVLIWAVYVALGPRDDTTGVPYRDSETVARGAALYDAHCAVCHGSSLEGQPNWRVPNADGRLPAPPHDATGHTWHHPDAMLIAITTHGTAAVVGGGYESDMIGFADVLSEDDILATLAFIKSTWPADIIAAHDRLNED